MPPGQAAPEGLSRQQAEKALVLLAQAGRLGEIYHLDTRTYHRFKARFQAQSKGEKLDFAAAGNAAPRQAVGRLDWFLTALELYRSNQFVESIAACEHVLQEHHNDFWRIFSRPSVSYAWGNGPTPRRS